MSTRFEKAYSVQHQPTFTGLTTEANARLVFNRAQAQRDHRQILETYDITWDRSEELRRPRVDPRTNVSQLP